MSASPARPDASGSTHRRTVGKTHAPLRWRKRDGHEHEAERSASAFLRGATGLGAGLSPAPAAGIFMPGSLGFPLPARLHRDLEEGFGADLSVVRVHTDAIAQAAALRSGARAFAAGNRLYFGRGQWSPFTVQGRMLIAHEVAHVLQQTGRTASGGRMRVEPHVAGAAGIQRDPDPNQAVIDGRDKLVGGLEIEGRFSQLDLLHPKTGVDACLAVLDRHAALPMDAEFMARAQSLRTAVTGKSDDKAVEAVSAEMTKLKDAEFTDAVRALYRDCFKSLGANDEAIGAAGDKAPPTTAFASWDFYASEHRGDGSWVVKFLSEHPVGKKYYPNAVVAVARLDFYGITRGGLNLDPHMAFDETMKDAIARSLTYNPLAADEREAVALRALAAFDTLRLQPFKSYKKAIEGKQSLLQRFDVKLGLIGFYKDEDFLPGLARAAKAEPELVALAVDAGKRIAPIARRAEIFWQRAKAATLATDRPKIAPDRWPTDDQLTAQARSSVLREAILKRLPAIKPLAKLEGELIKALRRTAQLENGGMPGPSALADNLAAAAKMVEAITYGIDGDLARRDKTLVMNELPKIDPDSADTEPTAAAITDDMIYGIVLMSMFQLQQWLLKAYAKPEKATDPDALTAQRDEAAKSYQTALNSFYDIAVLLGYGKLGNAVIETFLAQQKGVKKSYVGLLTSFEKDSVGLGELAKEFPDADVTGFPVSGAALVTFAYALYYGTLLDELKAALDTPVDDTTREFTYDPARTPIVNVAIEAVKGRFKPPQRYKVPKESTVLFVRPEDRDNVSALLTLDAGKKTQRDHPRKAALRGQMTSNQLMVTPKKFSAHKDGFVTWIVDDIDRLAEILANVPGVTDMPLENGAKLGWPSDYQNAVAWFLLLGKLVENSKSARDALDAAVRAQMELEHKALEGPLRRATNNQRRTIGPLIAQQWERVQVSFLKDPQAFFEAPKLAMQYTLTFLGNIQPATDAEQKMQMAMLMLELAPVLNRKLASKTHFGDLVTISGTDRFDIVLPLHPYLRNAAQMAALMLAAKDTSPLARFDIDFKVPDLQRRANMLASLAAEFEKTVENYQAETVMEGLPGENMLHVPGRGYPLYGKDEDANEPGTTFMQNGNVYELVKVHRQFQYQPEILGQPSMIETEGQPIGVRKLTIDGKDVAPGDTPVDLFTIMYTPHGGQTAELVVRSDNVRMLSEMTYALHINITMEALGDLAAGLNEFASVLTALIQLAFPEFAPAIAAAEIAGSIIQFWGTPEFATIKAVMNGDVGEVFSKGFDKLKSDLTLAKLWDYLLFGDEPDTFAVIRAGFQAAGRVNGMRGRDDDDVKKSSIKRVVGGILGAGSKVVGGAERVHQHTRFAFDKLELSVQGSPWAALILRVVARNLHRLDGLSLREAGLDAAVDAVEGVQDTLRRFETVLAALNEYELPEELVPLEVIIEMVVNFVIDHLPFKYRKPLQGVRGVVNAVGPLRELYVKIFEKVADELREARIDPNILWREYARKALDPYLKDAASGISKEAHDLLTKVPFLKELQAVNVPAVATSFVQGEMAPKLNDEHILPLAPPRLPAGRGTPLSRTDRAAAQAGFGHDFSHVRIHRGSGIDSGLRPAGVRAAAAGSHVYLDSSINTATPGGRQVLHHELAHVLQQTGSRPLGERHSAQPAGTSGAASGSGPAWRMDSRAEAQADSLAAASAQPAAGPRAVAPSAGGIQPSLTDIVERFFKKLGDPTALIEHADKMTSRLTGPNAPKAADLAKAAPGLKNDLQAKLVEHLKEAQSGAGPMTFASPFDGAEAKAAMLSYVLDNKKSELAEIDRILPLALKQVDIKQDKKSPKAKTEKVWVLDTGRLETILEEFFFGKTSVSIDVELHTKEEAGPDGKQRPAVDMTKPFKTLRVTYIHLPMIGGGSHIWDHVIDANFPKAGPKRAIYQAKARLALQGLQPSPFIFSKGKGKNAGKLMFSASTLKQIEDYVDPPPARDLPGDQAPKWADYIATDAGATTGKYGQIGLRLGFYRDKNNPAQQKGTDRAAHHTVQYLLIEYLVNTKDRHKPFPHPLSLYPNIVAQGQQVKTITRSPGGNSGIQIADNDKGDRGPNMPTILLSNHAHIYGDVHISPKPDDLDTAGASQGGAINGVFRDKLGDGYRDLVRDKPALEAMAKKRSGKPLSTSDTAKLPKIGGAEVTPEALSTAIYNATCKTYTWMRDHMNQKLEAALDKHEVEYYRALVATAKSTAIYSNNMPQAGYEPGAKIGPNILDKVREKQKETLEGATFGFEPMT